MSRYIAAIPLSEVSQVQIYINRGIKTLEQIRRETGADYLINGGLYNIARQAANCHLKADGYVWAEDPYGYWGYGWDDGPDISMELIPAPSRKNYICCVALLKDGKPQKLIYDTAMGGQRRRTAMGLKDGRLMLFCGTDPMTPEDLRGYLQDQGWASAVMLDGGGSSQCDLGPGKSVISSRMVHNLILVYTKKTMTTPPDEKEEKPMGNYKVKAVVGLNIRREPRADADKIGGYQDGTVVSVLEVKNGWGRTDKGWVSMTYLEPVRIRVTDTGIPITMMEVPSGAKNRPGGHNPDQYITIHETDNYARGADAVAHGKYVASEAAAQKKVSWHYTVDDSSIVQHLPDDETAYHASDGNGPGNVSSIGIEICVNEGGDFEATKANAASLVRLLMKEHRIPIDHVVQHNHWSGKNCPRTIRGKAGAWAAFLALCGASKPEDAPWYQDAMDWAVSMGISDGARPMDTCTRAEMWTMLHRIYKAIQAGK